ncbi:hypothetical protein [Pontivivens insulae]|uniref:Uncharacterized protein n=1 Tax=Pontivivens insulae TaxID=1639689 RepID=A0A2R8AD80_9RHOB|nr:hypothetical protein [Pontivivens insulae]RED14122.1 hypothetical protein DFR53_1476 [Pontivivens insulae]SPF30196.1 hypothetical protein POI8812_02531 [Pontivivens insulae]
MLRTLTLITAFSLAGIANAQDAEGRPPVDERPTTLEEFQDAFSDGSVVDDGVLTAYTGTTEDGRTVRALFDSETGALLEVNGRPAGGEGEGERPARDDRPAPDGAGERPAPRGEAPEGERPEGPDGEAPAERPEREEAPDAPEAEDRPAPEDRPEAPESGDRPDREEGGDRRAR